MLQRWARLAYGMRPHVQLMKKGLGHFGKEIWSQLLIVFLIQQSISMLMNDTKVSVPTFKKLPSIAFNVSSYCLSRSFLPFQMLKLIPGIERHQRSASADIFVHFVGGGLAGMTAASVTYPLDLVRTRLAAQVKISNRWINNLWSELFHSQFMIFCFYLNQLLAALSAFFAAVFFFFIFCSYLVCLFYGRL